MRKLLYTSNIPYDMRDWKHEPIVKVFAGTNCLMALTSDGRTLLKTAAPDYAPRTQFWTRVREIALSGTAPCHAIGLISDGTCMIAKRSVRTRCEQAGALPFEEINAEVKRWRGITQVAVNDTFFVLDESGAVHMAPLSQYEKEDYAGVPSWRDIVRVVSTTSNTVFGITRGGGVRCAGGNLAHGPQGDCRERLAALENVADICTSGAEAQVILIAFKDGTVTDLSGRPVYGRAWTGPTEPGLRVFQPHFWYETVILNNEKRIVRWQVDTGINEVFENCPRIASYAVGDANYERPFVIAVSEEY